MLIFSYDSESLEMLQTSMLKEIVENDFVDNDTCQKIAANFISEAILDGLLANKNRFNDFALTYELHLKNENAGGSGKKTLTLKPKQSNAFSKITHEAKSTQTMMDLKIDKTTERSVSNISAILNSILKLKHIKKPLSKLPNSSDVAKTMKNDLKEKLYEQ